MKNTLLIYTLLLILTASCKEKPVKTDIIVPPPAKEMKKGVQQMQQSPCHPREIEWLGGRYQILVDRKTDKSLPLAKDENGLTYYDNSINLKIVRADSTVFYNRTFTKSDFKQYVQNTGFEKTGALLGIVFDQIKDNKLIFAASVGSPDILSDEFVPMILTINRMGEISISLDTKMDADTDGGDMEDEGV